MAKSKDSKPTPKIIPPEPIRKPIVDNGHYKGSKEAPKPIDGRKES